MLEIYLSVSTVHLLGSETMKQIMDQEVTQFDGNC